ncbi:beta-lactamase [Leptospira ryugenii]|uniref:Beta-lactamase n=1 Tax=Leptospira ryugenii TaxID=1917863 RepID=A0A2P2E490_9LEPT|nr:serine hydrolase domain-containing protein [Leptospira ryugenii]GBF51708.1 beta-lactamase [Leptospira ryugenii]
MNKEIEIQGICHPKFRKVREVFFDNFRTEGEVGAALCIYQDQQKVVDLWAGKQNLSPKTEWQENTTVPIFSVTKGLTSLCFLMLADREVFRYEDLVQKHWAEFSANGKETITIQQLLEHKAGLHALEKKLHISDFWENPEVVYQALIRQKPAWKPGEKQGYGAQIWGAYAAELFQKIQGESAGVFFAREVANKLGLNLYIGLPDSEKKNVALLYPVSNLMRILKLFPNILTGKGSEGRAAWDLLFGRSEVKKAYMNPSMGLAGIKAFNDAVLHKQELLWANAIGDARSLAKLFQILALGGGKQKEKLVSKQWIQRLSKKQLLNYDLVIHKPMAWRYGFLKEELDTFSPNPETFGHAGMGGSLVFADPKERLSFGYVCNALDHRTRAPKTLKLCRALYSSIGQRT